MGLLSGPFWISRPVLMGLLRVLPALGYPALTERATDRILNRLEARGWILRVYTNDGGVLYGPSTEDPRLSPILRLLLQDIPARKKEVAVIRFPEEVARAIGKPELAGQFIVQALE